MEQENLIELYLDYRSQYRNVFMEKINGYVFIFRSITRSEWKALVSSGYSTEESEDILCETALLYPPDFDLDQCEAGLPTILSDLIIERSYLKDKQDFASVVSYYRSEMYNVGEQTICIINEAFPNLDIEEIEEWDLDQLAKYYSRAEWKLVNLRGLQVTGDMFGDDYVEPESHEYAPSVSTSKIDYPDIEELKYKFPEIDWDNDEIAKNGIDGLKVKIDTTPVALRVEED